MPSVKSLLSEFEKLSTLEQEQLFNLIGEVLTLSTHTKNIIEEVRENRFSKGKICLHCDSNNVVRNGKYNGKQRYLCKDCGKTFSDFTQSPISNSKKPLDKWLKYAECMIMGYSIRRCAKIVGINIATSFFWRHKILDAIAKFMDIGSVDGVIEADEVFFAESFKGNHKKSKTFKMPRKARKRGKQVKKRGISKEQICVATAIDRQGNIIIELICKGRMTHKELKKLYDGHIGESSILCTDSHKSYIQFAKDFDLDHKRIKRGRHKEGVYHIQHINSLHSKLKKWMYKFHGVSTKFLKNYLYWFKWLQFFDEDKELIKSKNFLVHSNSKFVKVKIDDFKTREPVFI
ncbi:IS1595 family transposase [Clostridium sp. ZS2-4]|uniref:IS1595 family transposase n=1 Tax=Clostridium sp. ZS2-4 TaxID=2987703 RepID=UPI00227A7A5A|nr:IS1595 family transposase [Clostridium sp. ZS2-4]MCY6354809.1 IS1595 family transposase [Clostridium sp. ZS2-4]